MRMRFEGDACTTGPEAINQRLPQKRATAFHGGFLRFIKKQHSVDYSIMSERSDPPVGFGETRPLSVERLTGKVILIGDNESPIGRKLNRRIEIIFYSTQKELKIKK